MLLAEKIQNDIKSAMKSGQKDTVRALRMLHAGIKNKQIEQGGAVTDDDVIRLVQSSIKQRKDSATQYTDAGRDDLAAQELSEIEVFSVYLPEQLSEAELSALVDDAVATVGATSMKDMGAVMKQVMAACAGRAEGAAINALVRARLG